MNTKIILLEKKLKYCLNDPNIKPEMLLTNANAPSKLICDKKSCKIPIVKPKIIQ